MKILLSDLILTIVELGKRRGLTLSEEDIAKRANLSKEQLNNYLLNQQSVPDDLIITLESLYQDIVGDTRMIRVECTDEENNPEEEDSFEQENINKN